MSRYYIYIVFKFPFILFLINIINCASITSEHFEIDKYFWQADKGRKYIYSLSGNGYRSVKITNVEYFDSWNLISTEEVMSLSNNNDKVLTYYGKYKIFKDKIVVVNPFPKSSLEDDLVLLNGPIKVGKKWKIKNIMQVGNEQKVFESDCEIANIDDRMILENEVKCVTISCGSKYDNDKFRVYCKGIGFVKSEYEELISIE